MALFTWMRIYNFISFCITVYTWIIIIRALISWFNPNPYNPIIQFLSRITEPVLRKIQRLIPFSIIAGLDLAPLFLIFFLWGLDWVVFKLFVQLTHAFPF